MEFNYFTNYSFEKREEINWNDKDDINKHMCENHIGTNTVLYHLWNELKEDEYVEYLKKLDDLNIRGEQIWYIYAKLSERDIKKFKMFVKNNTKDIIFFLEKHAEKFNHNVKSELPLP